MNANGKRDREGEAEAEPEPKKAKRHTNAALETVLDLAFDGQRRDLPHLPHELRALIVDYTAPSPLRQLADDPEAELWSPAGTTAFMSDLFEAALDQVFHAFATHRNEHDLPLCRTMTCEDYVRFDAAKRPSIAREERLERWRELVKEHGMPNRIERFEISFDGFCERMKQITTKNPAQARRFFTFFADHFEPVHAYTV